LFNFVRALRGFSVCEYLLYLVPSFCVRTEHRDRCISIAAKNTAHTQLFSSEHGNCLTAKYVDFGGLRIFFCLVCHLAIMVTSVVLTSESSCVNVFTALTQKAFVFLGDVQFWYAL